MSDEDWRGDMVKRLDASLAMLATVAREKGYLRHDPLCFGRIRDGWCGCGATKLREDIARWERERDVS